MFEMLTWIISSIGAIYTIVLGHFQIKQIRQDLREKKAQGSPSSKKGEKQTSKGLQGKSIKAVATLITSVVLILVTVMSYLHWALPHQGVISYDGGSYTGQIAKGTPDGEGTITYTDRTITTGLWENGKLKGGKTTYANGDIFDFEVPTDDQRVKQGTYMYRNLHSYGQQYNIYFSGTFDESKAATNYDENVKWRMIGLFHYNDGTEINGEFKWHEEVVTASGIYNGMMSVSTSTNEPEIIGYGTLRYNDARTYIGEFKNEQPTGFGEMAYSDGSIFTGNFSNGERNGMGVTYSQDGIITNQQYVDDVLIPCEIELNTIMTGNGKRTELSNMHTYKVEGGETLDITADDSNSDIAFIGYYFTNPNENERGYGYRDKKHTNNITVDIPEKPSNTDRLYLLVEAVADNDNGEPNYVTKTGWYQYTFVYEE